MQAGAIIGGIALVVIIFVIRWLINQAAAKTEQAVTNAVRHKKNEKRANEIIYLRDIYPDVMPNSNAMAGIAPMSGFSIPVSDDSWKCENCGRINKNYVSSCACGKTVQESRDMAALRQQHIDEIKEARGMKDQPEEQNRQPASSEPAPAPQTMADPSFNPPARDWKCNSCGTVNEANVYCCKYCGSIKLPGNYTTVDTAAEPQTPAASMDFLSKSRPEIPQAPVAPNIVPPVSKPDVPETPPAPYFYQPTGKPVVPEAPSVPNFHQQVGRPDVPEAPPVPNFRQQVSKPDVPEAPPVPNFRQPINRPDVPEAPPVPNFHQQAGRPVAPQPPVYNDVNSETDASMGREVTLYCNVCGAPHPASNAFCTICGARF